MMYMLLQSMFFVQYVAAVKAYQISFVTLYISRQYLNQIQGVQFTSGCIQNSTLLTGDQTLAAAMLRQKFRWRTSVQAEKQFYDKLNSQF